MKKYNLSKIMKRAWELVKKVGFGISEALKKAWNEAKEGLGMRGTEKQKAFAKKLIAKMNEEFDGLLKICPEDFRGTFAGIKEGYNREMANAYAGDVISLLINNGKTGLAWYKTLYYRVELGCDALEMNIKRNVYGK